VIRLSLHPSPTSETSDFNKELAALASLLQCLATRRKIDETISPSDGYSLEQKIDPVTLAQLETY
jgi:hypothetical protein